MKGILPKFNSEYMVKTKMVFSIIKNIITDNIA